MKVTWRDDFSSALIVLVVLPMVSQHLSTHASSHEQSSRMQRLLKSAGMNGSYHSTRGQSHH